MKGLIIKDLYTISENMRNLIFITVTFGALAVITGEKSVFSTLIPMITAMIMVNSVSTFSYDEISQWDHYCAALPVKRSRVVLARYLVTVIIGVAGTAFALLMALVCGQFVPDVSMSDTAIGAVSAFMAIMLLFSITLPVIYKYGVQKMRIISLMIVFFPVAIGVLYVKLGLPLPTEETIVLLVKLAPIVTLIALMVSYQVSVGIYRKKEF